LTIIDLKDCFFTIPLDPADVPPFAFSVPSVNVSELCARYHLTVLPQGMENSPTIRQWFVARALGPAREQLPQALLCHCMDDILMATKSESEMQEPCRELF
ncbi:POK6 protein, partial [Chionis minor]|nr:POK6 protein [Chionis minor]